MSKESEKDKEEIKKLLEEFSEVRKSFRSKEDSIYNLLKEEVIK